jgi:hypothetical protein
MARLPEPITTEGSSRQVIEEDFKPLPGQFPIKGVWGYARDDAVLIDADDPAAPKGVPFNGVAIEYAFVEKRIYEEMIIRVVTGSQASNGSCWSSA